MKFPRTYTRDHLGMNISWRGPNGLPPDPTVKGTRLERSLSEKIEFELQVITEHQQGIQDVLRALGELLGATQAHRMTTAWQSMQRRTHSSTAIEPI